MAGPFPSNATLVFRVPTGDTVIDELGNPAAITVEFTVQAYFRKVSYRGQVLDDADLSRVQVKGRCVEPERLSPELLPGTKATITVGNLSGEFFLEASISPPTEWGIEDALGQKLEGFILGETIWGNVL